MAQIVASPTHPASTEPIVEIPGTPRIPEHYTFEELKEEMNKVKAAQIRVEISFENKLRDTLTYLLNMVDWATFYTKVTKLANILKGLRDSELTVRTILDIWIRRE